ncbi:MAG: iron ABC transporter permease [Planctomycetota bacterium]|nr:iron ABC transporter permease [Planctomycetota bacterium]
MSRRAGAPVLLACLLALAGGMLFGLRYGIVDLPAGRIVGILAHALGLAGEPGGESWHAAVLLDVRLPRVLLGALVGGGLALCGAAMQGLFRNPLASPGVLGVSTGAAVGAVLALYLGLAAQSIWALPLLGTLGAAVTAFVVYGVATRRGQTPLGTLLLAGIAFGSLNGAITAFILSISLADYRIAGQIMYWTLGGLDRATWDYVKLAAPAILLGSAAIVYHARDLDALLLGETQAASVGVDVPRVRRRVILATALVTGVAVSVAGAIGFVGLVIPHILRFFVGPAHRWLFPASLLGGAAFLVLADLFARWAIAPEELRLGVVTAAVGAPFFIFLLLRRRKEGWW